MRRICSILLFVLLLLSLIGCKKSASQNIIGGGKGGSGSIWVTPTHGNSYVDSCMVYIKYGQLNAPADGHYDDSAKCIVLGGKPLAIFDSLSVGLYYVCGTGYHQLTKLNVRGATIYTMSIEQKVSLYLPTYSY